jgi:hypothetical protein
MCHYLAKPPKNNCNAEVKKVIHDKKTEGEKVGTNRSVNFFKDNKVSIAATVEGMRSECER